MSDSEAETRQAEQRDAGHSERSGRSLAQSTVTIPHHNTPGLTHRERFWQTSIQRPGWLAGLRGEVGREEGCWHESMWKREQQRKLLPLVRVTVWISMVWCEYNKIFARPVAKPNKDADVGQSVSPKVLQLLARLTWNLEGYAESPQEDNWWFWWTPDI